jgi:hypothetical protein
MLDVVAALGIGFCFGALLQRAGLTHYARIVNVYRLRDLSVMVFMLSALAAGAAVLQVGLGLGLAARAPLPMTAILGNTIGGAVFGVGMATAGYCPGTIVAEAGEGRLDAWTAGISGLFVGAILYGQLQPFLAPRLARWGVLGNVTLAALAGVSPWIVVVIFAEVVALALVLLQRRAASMTSSA